MTDKFGIAAVSWLTMLRHLSALSEWLRVREWFLGFNLF